MNKELLDRFFKGDCSEAEAKRVMEWLHSEKSEDYFTDQLLDAWREYERNEDRNGHKNKTLISPTQPNETPREPSRKRFPAIWLRAAASFVLMAAALTLYLFSRDSAPSVTEAKNDVWATREIPKGQKLRTYLPDGSVVWLNSESSLRYPETFSDSVRLVELTGEAFFEVAKNQAKPFIVKAGHTNTIVLGTSFNINAYPENDGVTVSLIEGKVCFKAEKDQTSASAILQPGEGVYASNHEPLFSTFKVDRLRQLGWKDGILTFDKADFPTVISKLERWYGVTISAPELHNQTWSFSGAFDNENLSNVLMNLSYSRDFAYEINGKNVVITFK